MRDIEFFKETLYNTKRGFVSLAFSDNHSWNEHIYRVKDLGKQMILYEENPKINIYTSVNTFYKPKRNFENLYNLNALFCDIDCVKHDIPIKQAFKELIHMWLNNIIPEPSMVINSGRGLHVYWHLDNCFASTKNKTSFVPTYQALLNRFAQKLSFLGADFKSAEPSRVLGVPGTINLKSMTKREIIYPILDSIKENILHYKEVRYKIINLANTYLQKREYREKNITFEKRQVVFNQLTLAYTRMRDYKTLIDMRNKMQFLEGYRNQLLFNYGLENIDYTKSKENLYTSLLDINLSFYKSLDERELKGIIKSLEKTKFKKIKNQTIIEQLEISKSEQSHMRTLIEREIKVARYVEKKKQAIRNEEGLTSREQSKEEHKNIILESYYIQNLKQKEIAKKLQITESLVTHYLKTEINIEEKIIFLLKKKIKIREIKEKLSISNNKIYAIKNKQK